MNTIFPIDISKQIMLVMGEHAASDWMHQSAAYLCQDKQIAIYDCGTRFNAYQLARYLRLKRIEPFHLLKNNIRVSRAMTCYEVEAMIRTNIVSAACLFVFDLLSTFYDEAVALMESHRVLALTLTRLSNISQTIPVIISTRLPATVNEDRLSLFEALKSHAGDIRYEIGRDAPETHQLSLFDME